MELINFNKSAENGKFQSPAILGQTGTAMVNYRYETDHLSILITVEG